MDDHATVLDERKGKIVDRNASTRNCLDAITSRLVLFFLLLTGMIVLFGMRSVMPLTLLTMVKDQQLDEHTSTDQEKLCFKDEINGTRRTNYGGTLEWSMNVQYYIMTSFYWTYVLGQMIGGIILQKFTTKQVILYSSLTSAICNCCIPLASNLHYVIVISLQGLHGLFQALVWPSYYGIISFWSPTLEKNRFAGVFTGISLGSTISQIMAGFVSSRLGWPYVFYVAGGAVLIWVLAWYFLAYNTPEEHPRISPTELEYILINRGCVNKKIQHGVPWRSIVFSVPVWAIIITNFGRLWLHQTIIIYGSLYLKTVIGLDIESNGIWSALPATASFISSFFVTYVSDVIVRNNYIPLIYNRKLFSGISQIVPGILCFYFTRVDCNIPQILTVWCIFGMLTGASFAGSMVNVYDIAPNHSGPIMGYVQFFILLPSVVATYVAKIIMQHKNSRDAWQDIFNVAGALNLISITFYFIFASVEVQNWDQQGSEDDLDRNNQVNEELL